MFSMPTEIGICKENLIAQFSRKALHSSKTFSEDFWRMCLHLPSPQSCQVFGIVRWRGETQFMPQSSPKTLTPSTVFCRAVLPSAPTGNWEVDWKATLAAAPLWRIGSPHRSRNSESHRQPFRVRRHLSVRAFWIQKNVSLLKRNRRTGAPKPSVRPPHHTAFENRTLPHAWNDQRTLGTLRRP